MSLSPVRPARPWAARCAALAVAALLALPAAATPQYGVATLAAVNDTEVSAYTQAGYNATFSYGAWGPQWDPLAGATHYSACNPTLLGCLPVSGSSPGTLNPDATSSSSSSRLYVYPGEPYIDTQGTAYASADLARGKLGAAATGQRRPTGRPWLEGTDGRSAARLWETLNFHMADAAPDTRTIIQVSYEVDGVYSPGDLMPGMGFNFNFGLASIYGSSEAGGYTGGGAPGYWINPIMTWDGPGHMLFTAGYELVGEDDEIGLLMQLTTVGGFGSANFSHTTALTFDLPSNVSFTSASGVLLSATNPGGGGGGGTVPEPSAMALMAVAALGLRWSRRRA